MSTWALASHRQPLPAGQPEHRRRLTPVTRGWVQEVFERLGLTAEELRVDRLLAEVQATGGDPLRLTRLFGISDTTAIRYRLEVDPLQQQPEPQGRPGPTLRR